MNRTFNILRFFDIVFIMMKWTPHIYNHYIFRKAVRLFLLFYFFKIFLRVGVNNSGVLFGEIFSYMPSSAFVCDEWLETASTFYPGLLVAGSYLRLALCSLHYCQLRWVSAKWVFWVYIWKLILALLDK